MVRRLVRICQALRGFRDVLFGNTRARRQCGPCLSTPAIRRHVPIGQALSIDAGTLSARQVRPTLADELGNTPARRQCDPCLSTPAIRRYVPIGQALSIDASTLSARQVRPILADELGNT